jgi:hypothetical protein
MWGLFVPISLGRGFLRGWLVLLIVVTPAKNPENLAKEPLFLLGGLLRLGLLLDGRSR